LGAAQQAGMSVATFLQSIADDPGSAATTWLVLADWLEERGDARAELVRLRLVSFLHRDPDGSLHGARSFPRTVATGTLCRLALAQPAPLRAVATSLSGHPSVVVDMFLS